MPRPWPESCFSDADQIFTICLRPRTSAHPGLVVKAFPGTASCFKPERICPGFDACLFRVVWAIIIRIFRSSLMTQ